MDQTLFLQPLASHLMPESNAKVNNHLIYRRSIDVNAENRYEGIEGKESELYKGRINVEYH